MNLIDAGGAPTVFEAVIDGERFPVKLELAGVRSLMAAIRQLHADNINKMNLERPDRLSLLSELSRRDYTVGECLNYIINQDGGLATVLKLSGVPSDKAAKAVLTDENLDCVLSLFNIDPAKFRENAQDGGSKKAETTTSPSPSTGSE